MLFRSSFSPKKTSTIFAAHSLLLKLNLVNSINYLHSFLENSVFIIEIFDTFLVQLGEIIKGTWKWFQELIHLSFICLHDFNTVEEEVRRHKVLRHESAFRHVETDYVA